MAVEPWVTPEEVRAYTTRTQVQERSDEQLKVDIARAEAYIRTYTHNDFCWCDVVPDPVKMACLILAEAYCWNGFVTAQGLKSESFDDYSYTAELSAIDFSDLDLAALLDPWVRAEASGNVIMRLRRL